MTITSKTSYRVGIRTCSDYSPFGVELDGRTVSGGYRYGFQNHEKNDEIYSYGNHLSWGNNGMDSRIGRRWNLDPKWEVIPSQSPYSTNNNNSIQYTDPDGEFGIIGAIAGFLVGTGVGVVKAAINGEDFTSAKTWAHIGTSSLAGAAIGALPVSIFGAFAAGGVGFTSNLVDQGVDKGFAGDNILDLNSYNYMSAGLDGAITMATFGLGGYSAKLLRNKAILNNWNGPLNKSGFTKLFYNNPSLGGNIVGALYDLSKVIIEKGVKNDSNTNLPDEPMGIITLPEVKVITNRNDALSPNDEKRIQDHFLRHFKEQINHTIRKNENSNIQDDKGI